MSAPIAHGGALARAQARFGGRLEDWLDLSTGINPNPVALPEIPAEAWHRLPDQHRFAAARAAAAGYYATGGLLPLPVPGTQSVIQLVPRLVDPARRVAILGPTYGEYQRVTTLAGLAVDAVETLEEVTVDHGLAIVVNPNNPTGRRFAARDLLALAARLAGKGGTLLVDEAFADCDPAESVAGSVEGQGNLVVFRSFGKFFGLAGLRLGFVIADPATMERFETWLGPWAVSGPALVLAERLMRGDHAAIRAAIAERHAALVGVLTAAGLAPVGGRDLFALIDHPRAFALYEHLAGQHILVRPFDYAPRWLRIGLAPDRAADERLAQALSAFGPSP